MYLRVSRVFWVLGSSVFLGALWGVRASGFLRVVGAVEGSFRGLEVVKMCLGAFCAF